MFKKETSLNSGSNQKDSFLKQADDARQKRQIEKKDKYLLQRYRRSIADMLQEKIQNRS